MKVQFNFLEVCAAGRHNSNMLSFVLQTDTGLFLKLKSTRWYRYSATLKLTILISISSAALMADGLQLSTVSQLELQHVLWVSFWLIEAMSVKENLYGAM